MRVIRTIVVPHDFSDHANAALEVAVDMARQMSADLHLLHVIQPPGYAYASEFYAGGPIRVLGLREQADRLLQEVASGIPQISGLVEIHIIEGSRIAEAIDRFAEQVGADLITMGTHGRTGLAHLLLGSVAEQTLRQSPCPVLTVPVPKPHLTAPAQQENQPAFS